MDATRIFIEMTRMQAFLVGVVGMLLAGIFGFVVAWLLRQDKKIVSNAEKLAEVEQRSKTNESMIDRNVPDAWNQCDEARKSHVDTLKQLVLGRAKE